MPGMSSLYWDRWVFEVMGMDDIVQGECFKCETGGLRMVL